MACARAVVILPLLEEEGHSDSCMWRQHDQGQTAR